MIFEAIHFKINRNQILHGVSLRIEPGKVCGLFGPNGSGKTILIKIGVGLLQALSGTIIVDGQIFRKKKLLERFIKIAYLSQDRFLPRDITVSKFLNMLSTESKEFIGEHFPAKLLNHLIRSLSSGEHRLLELLFVLSLDRKYVLLDEPFTGIEPLIIEKMIVLISKQRQSGKGILVTDQYYRYTSRISDMAYLLKGGECRKLDKHTNLQAQLQLEGYLGQSIDESEAPNFS